jgi:hypothetical protein
VPFGWFACWLRLGSLCTLGVLLLVAVFLCWLCLDAFTAFEPPLALSVRRLDTGNAPPMSSQTTPLVLVNTKMQISFAFGALIWVVTSYILYAIISNFIISRRHAAKARELKCEEPPFEKNRWPLGIDNLLRALAADKAQQFPVDIIKRFEDLGAHTYRYQILGGCFCSLACQANLCRSFLSTTDTHFRCEEYPHCRSQEYPDYSRQQVQ